MRRSSRESEIYNLDRHLQATAAELDRMPTSTIQSRNNSGTLAIVSRGGKAHKPHICTYREGSRSFQFQHLSGSIFFVLIDMCPIVGIIFAIFGLGRSFSQPRLKGSIKHISLWTILARNKKACSVFFRHEQQTGRAIWTINIHPQLYNMLILNVTAFALRSILIVSL